MNPFVNQLQFNPDNSNHLVILEPKSAECRVLTIFPLHAKSKSEYLPLNPIISQIHVF